MNNPAPKRLSTSRLYDRSAVIEAVRLIVGEGMVTELRALEATTASDRRSQTVSGYFDDAEKLADALATIRSAKGIYFMPNPIDGSLLARAANRVRPTSKGEATADTHILRRHWLLIDADAKRVSGVSATDVEHEAAIQRARDVYAFLKSLGWPDPIAADSGNGGHLLYSIDLPVDDGGLVQRCLQALAARFDDDVVKIDTTVHNPARIWKLYGTVACKGDHTEDRPHRMARILNRPSDLSVVPLELLEALAPDVETKAPTEKRQPTNGSPRWDFDVDAFIARHSLDVDGPDDWNGKQGRGRRWQLRISPLCEHHDGAAHIEQHANGAITAGCHHNSCGWGWRELREHFEPRRATSNRSTAEPSSGENVNSIDIAWCDPEALPDELPPVDAFDLDLLPHVLRPLVKDIAERMQCPPDFPAVASMVMLAGVVGRRVGICPKQHDDWLVTPNLWGVVIGRPGLMKTPAIEQPLKFLKRLEVEAKRTHDAEMLAYGAEELVQKARKSVAETKLKQAIKRGDDAHELAATLLGDESARPVRRRYLCNDASVEKLGEILNENPNGVVVFRDELTGLLRSLDREGQETARAFFLEAWNGNGRFTFDRIGRGTIDIEAAVVSVLGGVQPGPLAEYLRAATRNGSGDDGLIQRLQMAVWPDASPNWRNVDRWPDTEARLAVWKVVCRIHNSTFDMFPESEDGLRYLRFSDAAQVEFDQWRATLEPRLRSGELHAAMESHLAKYRSLVPTLALLIELAERPDAPSVTEDSLRRAIGWAKYLESHAYRIYAPAMQRDLVAAKALAAKIMAGKLTDGFALRDVYRAGWTHLNEREDALQATGVLIDSHWLKIEQRPTDGRTATFFRINPKLMGSPPPATDKADQSPSVSSVSNPLADPPPNSDDEWGSV